MKVLVLLILGLLLCPAFSKADIGGMYITSNNTDLVYNNAKDTIHLTTNSYNSTQDFVPGLGRYEDGKIFAEIQIDGKGDKEVVVYRSFVGNKGKHGGTYDITEIINFGVYEIWNLNNKELLFQSVNSYQRDFSKFNTLSAPRRTKGTAAYHYDFIIDDKGTIKIVNLSNVNNVFNLEDMSVVPNVTVAEDSIPDHQEGIYKFKNGKYNKK